MPECLRRSGNINSPRLDRGLAAYMSNMNACVAHLKCCEPKYARKFPLLTVNCIKMVQPGKGLHGSIMTVLFVRILLIVHHT